MPRVKEMIGQSPLTDPWSLAGSVVFHAFMLVAVSFAALSMVAPETPVLPHVLRGEIDTVDNRAPAREGGGAPGSLGGTDVLEALPPANGRSEQGAARDPAADALLAEVLPAPSPTEARRRALPGPQTTGIGVLPGPGTGGGGGSGGGSGGGVGKGVGPGTEFFGAREHAGSFAYVIDCSGSMASHGALNVAKRELMASLNMLPPDARFAVIFYNLDAFVLSDPGGEIKVIHNIDALPAFRATLRSAPPGAQGLMAATLPNKARVSTRLAAIKPDAGTNHLIALHTALTLGPEVIFFLTDADWMTDSNVNEVLADAGKTRIQCVVFGRGHDFSPPDAPLRRLGTATGGSYRYVDVLKFSETPQ